MKLHIGVSRATLAVFAVIAALAFICAGAIRVASTAWHSESERSVSVGVRLMDDSDDAIQQQIDQQQMIASQQQAEQQNELAQQEAQQAEQQGLLVEQQVQAGQ